MDKEKVVELFSLRFDLSIKCKCGNVFNCFDEYSVDGLFECSKCGRQYSISSNIDESDFKLNEI